MSGKKGMFDGRKQSPAYVDAVRRRIRAGGIVARLEKHVLGQIKMTSSQVQAALGLLKKVVPDLASVEHSGADGGPIEFKAIYFADAALQLHPEELSGSDTEGVGLRH